MTAKKQQNSINYTDQLKLAEEALATNDFTEAITQAEIGLERTIELNNGKAKEAGQKLEDIMAMANEALNEQDNGQPNNDNEATPNNSTTPTPVTNQGNGQQAPTPEAEATPIITHSVTDTTQEAAADKAKEAQAIQDKWSFLPLSPSEIEDFDLFSKSKAFDKALTVANIEMWLASYKELSRTIETPMAATNLMSAIINLEGDLTEARELPDKFRDFAISGIQAEIAELQGELSKIPSNTSYAFKAMVLWPIAKALFSENALKPAGKRAKGNGKLHTPEYEGALKLVKDYADCNLPYGGKVDVQCFIYGSQHPKVLASNLSIPEDKLGVFNLDGVMMGTISAQSKSGSKSVIAIAYVMGLAQNDAFEESFTTSGPIGWHESQHQDNGSKEMLDKFQPATLKANLLSDGHNAEKETEQAGSNGDTELELAK